MDRKDRHTLKSYFQKGDVPTEEQFAELIDSVPNIVDDGEAVRTEDGWALYPRKGGKMGVSLHEAAGGGGPRAARGGGRTRRMEADTDFRQRFGHKERGRRSPAGTETG